LSKVLARCLLLVTSAAPALAACATMEDVPAANAQTSLLSSSHAASGANFDGSRRNVTNTGSALVDTAPSGKTTVLEGSGQFIGGHASAHRPPATTDGDDVTLNLVNVPAPQAAKTILGDMLAVRYTIDPTIEGKITIQTPSPIAKTSVMDLFETALRANNAALIEANGIYKIVPADQAAVGARIRVGIPPDARETLGSGLHIVQLKYVSASEIRRILEPISPRGAIVRADDTRHTITLSGNREEIAGMLDAISIFDVDVMKGMSFALVPVKTSDPDSIADELRTVFASDREGPMAGVVRFLPNKRLRAILVISAQPKYLGRAESWVHRLDAQAAGTEKQFFTYSVQNRRAQELVDVLQAMFSKETGGGRLGGSGRNVAPPYQEATLQSNSPASTISQAFGASGFGSSGTSFPQGSMGQGVPGRPPARNAGTGDVDVNASTQAGSDEAATEPRIKIAADEAKNAILMEATQADYRRLMRVVGSLDVIPNQVLIEATIAEITLNDELKFGLRWYLNGKNANYSFTDDAGGAISSVFPGFSYALAAANISGTLNALNQITDVNVISSPSLTVVDNKTAFLQIGDQVPITTQSAVSVLSTGAPIVNSVTYKDTGVGGCENPDKDGGGRRVGPERLGKMKGPLGAPG
jgi:general secretion pathway protein D